MAKRKKPAEGVSGRYTAIPHALLDSVTWQGASPRCKALILELARQLDGKNNGHLHAAVGWLRGRGWSSVEGIQKAKAEALERGLIIRTRLGGLNAGADLYAVTWLAITNFVGLEIGPHQYHPGQWRFVETLPPPKKRHARTPEKRGDHTASRNGAVPPHGTAKASTVPPHGTKTAHFGVAAVPSHGNNEVTTTGIVPFRRVVGRAGRSGKPKAGTP